MQIKPVYKIKALMFGVQVAPCEFSAISPPERAHRRGQVCAQSTACPTTREPVAQGTKLIFN